MAGAGVTKVTSPFAIGQRLWNAWSAWTIKNSGYQKLGTRDFECIKSPSL